MDFNDFASLIANRQKTDDDLRITLDGDKKLVAQQPKLGGRNVTVVKGEAPNMAVRRELLKSLNTIFNRGIPASVLKAMKVSSRNSGFAVKNGQVVVSDHPLTMRRLKEIVRAVTIEQECVHDLLMGSLGDLLVKPKAGRTLSGKDQARNAAVARDVVDLFKTLVTSTSDDSVVDIFCSIGGKGFRLTQPYHGKLKATIDGTTEGFNVGTNSVGLLARLADEIVARPDLFGGFFAELLAAFPTKSEDSVEARSTLVRSFCAGVIQSVAGVSAHWLANITTANLLDIAKETVKLGGAMNLSGQGHVDLAVLEYGERPGFEGVKLSGFKAAYENEKKVQNENEKENVIPAGWEVVMGARDLVEARVRQLEKVGERDYISTADATTLIEALRVDEDGLGAFYDNVEVSDTFHDKKAEAGQDEKAEAERAANEQWAQDLRNFAADLLLPEDSTLHDQEGLDAKKLAAVLDRHAETLAKLLIARANPDGLGPVFSGVSGEVQSVLESLLNRMPIGEQQKKVEDENQGGNFLTRLAAKAMKKANEATTLKFDGITPNYLKECDEYELATKLREAFGSDQNTFALASVATGINVQVDEALRSVQGEIEKALNTAFKAGDEVKSVMKCKTIKDMQANAEKPGNTGYGAFVQAVLSGYITEAELVDKRAMAAAMLRYAPQDATEGQMLAAMLKGAGPLLQKILQGFDPTSINDENLVDAIKDMKKNLAPIPEEVVKANLNDIVVRSGGKITKIEAMKTLGCASVGQAILCKVKGPGLPEEGREVVVKILRPNALRRIEREKAFILKIAKEKGMKDSYQSQLDAILEEFDFKHEAENIEVGKVYDKAKAYPRVQAVKVEGLASTSTMTLMMECAPGSTAEDVLVGVKNLIDRKPPVGANWLKEEYERLLQLQKDLCDLSRVWVTEGLYGSGFFHGDLHSGNIMLDAEKGVTMIDFGNVTQLSKSEQKSVTRMMTAATLGKKPDGPRKKLDNYNQAVKVCVQNFMEGLDSLLSPAGQSALLKKWDEVKKMLTHVLSAGEEADTGPRIFVALTELQRMGIDIPGPIFKFSQSQMRLQTTIDQMNSLIGSLGEQIRDREYHMPNEDLLKSVSTSFMELCAHYQEIFSYMAYLRGADFHDQVEKTCEKFWRQTPAIKKEIQNSLRSAINHKNAGLQIDLPRLLENIKGEEVEKFSRAINPLASPLREEESERLVAAVSDIVFALYEEELNGMLDEKATGPFEPAQSLDDFVKCMGKVIKQNLFVTKKRVSFQLASAVQNN